MSSSKRDLRVLVQDRRGWAAIAASAGILLLAACSPRNEFKAPPPAVVTVQKPIQKEVTSYLVETGQLQAVKSVTLVARVEGFLTSIDYKDGAAVKKGTQLFTIERPPYKASSDQAKGTLSADQAKAIFAEQQNKRFSTLAQTNAGTIEQAEQYKADAESAEAAVVQTQAAAEQAAIRLSYTSVLAPFDGTVSAHLKDVGDLVGTGTPTPLATIVQIDPIWVNFTIDEPDVIRLRARRMDRGEPAAKLETIPVEIGLQGQTDFPFTGHMDYVAPTLDAASGTLAARGIFDNKERRLLPGYFVRVRVPIDKVKNALLVPNNAVGSAQGGPFLLVVNADDVVEQRSIIPGEQEGDLRVVTSGLKADDRVIVDGLQRAKSGDHVNPHEAQQAAGGTETKP